MFTAPLFSALCALATYAFVKEIRGQGAGLLASAFIALVPSYISRSVAGSFDNEGRRHLCAGLRLLPVCEGERAHLTCTLLHSELTVQCVMTGKVASSVCQHRCLHPGAQHAASALALTVVAGVADAQHVGSLAWATAAAVAYLYMVRPCMERLQHLPIRQRAGRNVTILVV